MPKSTVVYDLIVAGAPELEAAQAYTARGRQEPPASNLEGTVRVRERVAFLAGILWERARATSPVEAPEPPLDVKAALALIAKELGL